LLCVQFDQESNHYRARDLSPANSRIALPIGHFLLVG
jgi:hypothetical protein